jgi:hypothetical protein
MTSERHRCRVLRRRIEALELAGDPAPTTPRCFTSRGRRLSVKGCHTSSRASLHPHARPATHFVRGTDLVIVAELLGFPGMHPDAGGKASPRTPPGRLLRPGKRVQDLPKGRRAA